MIEFPLGAERAKRDPDNPYSQNPDVITNAKRVKDRAVIEFKGSGAHGRFPGEGSVKLSISERLNLIGALAAYRVYGHGSFETPIEDYTDGIYHRAVNGPFGVTSGWDPLGEDAEVNFIGEIDKVGSGGIRIRFGRANRIPRGEGGHSGLTWEQVAYVVLTPDERETLIAALLEWSQAADGFLAIAYHDDPYGASDESVTLTEIGRGWFADRDAARNWAEQTIEAETKKSGAAWDFQAAVASAELFDGRWFFMEGAAVEVCKWDDDSETVGPWTPEAVRP